MTKASTVAMNSSYPCGSRPPGGKKSSSPVARAMKPSRLVPIKTEALNPGLLLPPNVAVQPRRLVIAPAADGCNRLLCRRFPLSKEEHIDRLDDRPSTRPVAVPANGFEAAGQFVFSQSREHRIAAG